MKNYLLSESYHSFQIIPISIGRVVVQKGVVVHSNNAFTIIPVTGATDDVKNQYTEPISIENGGTISVLINHSAKDETNDIVNITSCEISNLSESPDSNTKTVVKIGTVTWVGELAEINQELRSDIFCTIYGTGEE